MRRPAPPGIPPIGAPPPAAAPMVSLAGPPAAARPAVSPAAAHGQGVGLMEQGRWMEAMSAFSAALLAAAGDPKTAAVEAKYLTAVRLLHVRFPPQ